MLVSGRLEDQVSEAVAGTGMPGGIAIVAERLERSSAATGVRRTDREAALDVADRLHIGSCTKSITAAVIGSAVEREEISWGSTIGEMLDHDGPYAAVDMTDLLAHRGGLQPFEEDHEFSALGELPSEPVAHRRACAGQVLEMEPSTTPQTEFRYSNAGYGVATAMLEKTATVTHSFEVHDTD